MIKKENARIFYNFHTIHGIKYLTKFKVYEFRKNAPQTWKPHKHLEYLSDLGNTYKNWDEWNRNDVLKVLDGYRIERNLLSLIIKELEKIEW